MKREEADRWIDRLDSYQLEPVFNRWDSRRRKASKERKICSRCTTSFLPWHLSMPQHCLMSRWYSSLFHPRSLNDILSDSDASRISVAQCSGSLWSERSWTPWWNRIVSGEQLFLREGHQYKKTERLYVWSGSTNRLDLCRVHQCHFSERINFRLSILEYHESKMT